ncbi:MAG TPA: hypothetical protein VHX39_25020, partial [Acetobacteraceae bacterium]|nr:hypothetical protein [Acetobacteraceae bacterium]
AVAATSAPPGRRTFYKVGHWTAAELRASLAGTTMVHYTHEYGTQVSYYSPAGREWLWFPGNSALVPEQWRTEDRPTQQAAICFKDPPNSFDAVTLRRGGDWECHLAMNLVPLGSRLAQRKGDVFGLSQRSAPPFVTSAAPGEFDHIVALLPPASPDDEPPPLKRVMLHEVPDAASIRAP